MRNKYGNIKKVCSLGHRHDSKLEADYCNRLRLLAKGKAITAFQVQRRFPLVVNGRFICAHVVDFLVLVGDHHEVHETKGVKTAVWKIKHKLFQACYPDIKYFIIEG